MLILTMRTDKPEAEIGLFNDTTQIAYQTWQAHRILAETIHTKITELLEQQGKTLYDLGGIVCFKGPGSFTGLRIGLTVGNTLAYGLDIPVVGAGDDAWIAAGTKALVAGHNDHVVMPEYGAPVHITEARK